MLFVGLDVGGANTKVAVIDVSSSGVRVETAREYFPVWVRSREELPGLLLRMKKSLCGGVEPDIVCVTMTAEISDAYETKREGVSHVLSSVEEAFGGVETYVVSCMAELLSVEEARKRYRNVAAANWPATGWMIGKMFRDCIFIDVGSTTTDIIPVRGGVPCPEGRTDVERLISGELVFTGVLRTNISAVASRVPLRGRMCRVSPEKFALTADVHLVLGHISEEDYTCETADGRGKDAYHSMARIARAVCADLEEISGDDVLGIARHVYLKQLEQVIEGLEQVSSRNPDIDTIVTVGLGEDFLARRAAESLGFRRIQSLKRMIGGKLSENAPAVAAALMVAEKRGADAKKLIETLKEKSSA